MTEKLIKFLQNHDATKGSLTIRPDTMRCLPCEIDIPVDKRLIYKSIRHFNCKQHMDKCCWSLEKSEDSFMVKKHKSTVHQSVKNFFEVSVIKNSSGPLLPDVPSACGSSHDSDTLHLVVADIFIRRRSLLERRRTPLRGDSGPNQAEEEDKTEDDGA